MTTRVFDIGIQTFRKLKKYLTEEGFELKGNEVLTARKSGMTVTLFKTGKVMIQGKNIEGFASEFSKKFLKAGPPRIGTDEAGKGDYFGYLVAAGVFVDSRIEGFLVKEGVRDSKQLSDQTIENLAQKIKKNCVYSIVRISPQKYNQLYRELGNLNVLLAWAHARVIENLLGKVECNLVISDQFGSKRFLESKLMKKGRKVKLIQRPRAEDDVAVASASILARAYYLKSLKRLSEEHDIEFPRGSTDVVGVGKKFVDRYGGDTLPKVAKMHFKTTRRVK